MKKKERELVEKLLTEWIVCYKDCFCQDSPEKWIKMFAEKRLETFLADKKDYIEEVTGVDLSNSKNLKEFRSLYKSIFLEIITNHLVEVKNKKSEELKREIKEKGVRRKKGN